MGGWGKGIDRIWGREEMGVRDSKKAKSSPSIEKVKRYYLNSETEESSNNSPGWCGSVD